MSGEFTFVADIFAFTVDTLVLSTITNVITAISPLLKTTMFSMFGLYAVYLSGQWMFNRSEFPLMEGMKILGLLSIVTFFAFNTSAYINNIVPIVLGSGDELAGLISGTSNTAQSLDKFITVIVKTILEIWDNTDLDWFSGNVLVSLLNIVIFMIGSVPFVITSFGILLTAKIMVALLLCTGTLYICFALFKPTRHWFQQWLNLCLNYALIAFLFPIAFSFMIMMVEKFVYVNGTLQVDIGSAFKVLIILGAFLAISVQIPVLASSLSGGVGINGMSGSFGAMSNAVKGALGYGKSAGKGAVSVGKGAVSVHKAIQRRRGNNIKAG